MEYENTTTWKYKVKAFVMECVRVLKVTKKPNMQEFKTTVKVSGLGILIIGAMGFIFQMVKILFF